MKLRLIILALAIAVPVAAHHSAAAIYAVEKTMQIEGIVTRFSLGNPHMRIFFTRPDQQDKTSEWVAEGGSRTVLARRGWTQDTVKPGEKIVMQVNPARDERHFVHINEITLPDGRKLTTEDVDPTASLLRNPSASGAATK